MRRLKITPVSRVRLLLSACLSWSVANSVAGATPDITRIERSPNGGVTLHWQVPQTPAAFTVQSRAQLGDGIWIPAPAQVPWPVRESSFALPLDLEAQAQFYRVRMVAPSERGKILATSTNATLHVLEVAAVARLAGVSITPQFGVVVHKLTYETIGPWGDRTTATGVLALPQGYSAPLPLASYQHGTLAQKTEAPSAVLTGETLIGILFASQGYAMVLPDYLGLGDSPGIHPYHHARSEATAGVDLLRAARFFCQERQVALGGRLFLLGYSQGGHATMALARELETYHADEFTITAAAPMAGAYDLSGVTTEDYLKGSPVPNPYYFALMLAAFQDVYHLAPSLKDLLAPPYDQSLPPLLDGSAASSRINAVMPASPIQIMRGDLLQAFRTQPHHPLRVALRDNDLHQWKPRAPMRLYHCRGDRDVMFANAEVALASFHARGAAQVELIDPVPTADHGGCVLPSLLGAKAWFDSLRLP